MLWTRCAESACDQEFLLATECGNWVTGPCQECWHFFCAAHYDRHACHPHTRSEDEIRQHGLWLWHLAPPTSPFSHGLPPRFLEQTTGSVYLLP